MFPKTCLKPESSSDKGFVGETDAVVAVAAVVVWIIYM